MTASDRRKLRSDVHRLTLAEAELSGRGRDPGALILASHYRAMRHEAERALNANPPLVESLGLFKERE